MTREHKLALLIGFALVLVVGVVVSDHFSGAHTSRLADMVSDEGAAAVTTVAASNQALSSPLPVDRPATTPGAPLAGKWAPSSAGDSLGGAIGEAADSGLDHLSQYTLSMGEKIADAPPAVAIDPLQAQPADQSASANPPEASGRAQPAARPAPDDEATRAVNAGVAFPSYVIKKGDTLWTIAEAHYGDGKLHDKLEAFNKGRVGSDGALYPGATLLMPPRDVLLGKRKPVPSDAAPARTAARPEPAIPAPKTEPAKPAPPTRSYTVKSGDTLAEISQRTLGTTKRWREIAELNKLDDPDVVVVGSVLKIPAK